MNLCTWQRTGFVARSVSVLSLFLLSNALVHAQLPFQESFEDEPGTTYTLSGPFDDGAFDYFGRYEVPDTTNGARDDFPSGWDGGYGIHSQDNDGEGASKTATVDIAGIDISGSGAGNSLDLSIALTSTGGFEPLAVDNVRVAVDGTYLTATIALGALASEVPADGEEVGFDNYEAEDGDGIAIFATIDGGSAMEIGRFSPPAVGLNNMGPAGDLYLDPDGDGVGTGMVLTPELTDFSFSIAAVPEPSSLALGIFALLGIIATRNRRVS